MTPLRRHQIAQADARALSYRSPKIIPIPVQERIRDLVTELSNRKGLAELGRALRVHETTVGLWSRGERRPSKARQRAIVDLAERRLGADRVAEIMGDEA